MEPLHVDDDLCDDMECPLIFRTPDCSPMTCPRMATHRKSVGAIYIILPDDSEGFVALLTGTKRN